MKSHPQFIGRIIKTTRKMRGLSQANLAEKIGSSQPYIARLENGMTNISVELLMKIGEALDCHVNVKFIPMKVREKMRQYLKEYYHTKKKLKGKSDDPKKERFYQEYNKATRIIRKIKDQNIIKLYEDLPGEKGIEHAIALTAYIEQLQKAIEEKNIDLMISLKGKIKDYLL